MVNETGKKAIIAESYYQAMGRKNISEVEQYLHSEVQLIAPLAKTQGKEAFLEAASKFFSLFKTLKICEKFDNGDKAVIIYELDCPMPIGIFRAVALLSFKDELVSCVELFYDARPFAK